MAPPEYDAANRTQATAADAEAAIGKRAELHLTGTIVSTGVSSAGPYVMFEVDGRWGLGTPDNPFRMGFDLEALIVPEGQY